MSDEDPPEGGAGGTGTGAPASGAPASAKGRRRLEGVIPELLKRAIEIGVDRAQHSPESLKNFVGELKLPKEIVSYILQQVDETKNGLFRVVADEIRGFLETSNLSGEMKKMLTTVQFEINTTVRFTPNDGTERAEPNADGTPAEPKKPLTKPEVKTQVHVKREERPQRRRTRE